MAKKKQSTMLQKNQIFWFLNFIPLLRIKYKITELEMKGKRVERLTKMYWLFGFIPLFSTEKDYLPDNTKPEYKYYDDMPLI